MHWNPFGLGFEILATPQSIQSIQWSRELKAVNKFMLKHPQIDIYIEVEAQTSKTFPEGACPQSSNIAASSK